METVTRKIKLTMAVTGPPGELSDYDKWNELVDDFLAKVNRMDRRFGVERGVEP